MKCAICDKDFTGPMCYQQHIESEKHKKKEKEQEMYHNKILNSISASGNYSNTNRGLLCCRVCDVSFYDFKSYEIHVLSVEHADKVKNSNKNAENKEYELGAISGITSSLSLVTEAASESSKELPVFSVVQKNGNLVQGYLYCQPCDKQFSGPVPYDQHMGSKAHIKNTGGCDNNSKATSPFVCETCNNKKFNGPVPFEQHLKSEAHKKKLQNKSLLCGFESGEQAVNCGIISSSDSVTKNMQNVSQSPDSTCFPLYYCAICKKQCNGPSTYNSHLAGESHRKAEGKVQWQDYFEKLPSDRVPVEQIQVSSINKTNPIPQQMTNKQIQVLSAKKMESDVILPVALESFELLSLENTNLKFFLPDSELNFDMANESSSENEAKPKPEILKEICSSNELEIDMEESYYNCESSDISE